MAGVFVFTLFFLYLFGSLEAASNRGQKLVIDHDGGADDAFAITMSLLYEKYFNGPKVVALTTVFGNVNLTQAVINSNRILRVAGREDIPIYKGAKRSFIAGIQSDHYFGYDGLGDDGYIAPEPIIVEKEPAAVGLIELSKKYQGELVIIALGSLTNIALAISLDPDFIGRLSHLYVGAGHIYSKQYPKPEFNAEMDVEAYRVIANNAKLCKVTFVPFSQVYLSLTISNDWRSEVLGAIQTPIMKALTGFERKSFPSSPNWTLLDPAVAAIVLDPSIVEEFKNTTNSINTCDEFRGITTNYFLFTKPNSQVMYRANVDRYKQFLLDVYSAEINEVDGLKSDIGDAIQKGFIIQEALV